MAYHTAFMGELLLLESCMGRCMFEYFVQFKAVWGLYGDVNFVDNFVYYLLVLLVTLRLGPTTFFVSTNNFLNVTKG